MSDSDSGDDSYGPALPPGFKKPASTSKRRELDDEDAYLPSLPPHLAKRGEEVREEEEEEEDMFCPALPPHLQQDRKRKHDEESSGGKRRSGDTGTKTHGTKETHSEETNSEDEEDMYGPALPPSLLNKTDKKPQPEPSKEPRILGPTLPKNYIPPAVLPPPPEEEEEEEESEEEDGGEVIGPTPSAVEFDPEEYRIRELELRARKMRDKLEGKSEDKPLQRESWMTELPEDRKGFCGLEARQFSRKTPQEKGDRSVWTDTPADKERKAKLGDNVSENPADFTPESLAAKKRDAELSQVVDRYNTQKRSTALVDLHKKKKKEKEEGKPKERRPFSREEDMNVNKFDEVQREQILKKARQLGDRFSAGNKKFL